MPYTERTYSRERFKFTEYILDSSDVNRIYEHVKVNRNEDLNTAFTKFFGEHFGACKNLPGGGAVITVSHEWYRLIKIKLKGLGLMNVGGQN